MNEKQLTTVAIVLIIVLALELYWFWLTVPLGKFMIAIAMLIWLSFWLLTLIQVKYRNVHAVQTQEYEKKGACVSPN